MTDSYASITMLQANMELLQSHLDASERNAETWSARAVEAEDKAESLRVTCTALSSQLGAEERRSAERWSTSQAWEIRCGELQSQLSKPNLDAADRSTWEERVRGAMRQLLAAQDCIKARDVQIDAAASINKELICHTELLDEENARLLDAVAQGNREISALVSSIRRDEEEIRRLRVELSSHTRKTKEWNKP